MYLLYCVILVMCSSTQCSAVARLRAREGSGLGLVLVALAPVVYWLCLGTWEAWGLVLVGACWGSRLEAWPLSYTTVLDIL